MITERGPRAKERESGPVLVAGQVVDRRVSVALDLDQPLDAAFFPYLEQKAAQMAAQMAAPAVLRGVGVPQGLALPTEVRSCEGMLTAGLTTASDSAYVTAASADGRGACGSARRAARALKCAVRRRSCSTCVCPNAALARC